MAWQWFANALKSMSRCTTYQDLADYCRENLESMPPLEHSVSMQDLSLQSLFLEEDRVSTPLIPGDVPEKPDFELLAVDIYADGNCLPR